MSEVRLGEVSVLGAHTEAGQELLPFSPGLRARNKGRSFVESRESGKAGQRTPRVEGLARPGVGNLGKRPWPLRSWGYSGVVRSTDSGLRQCGFKCQLNHL